MCGTSLVLCTLSGDGFHSTRRSAANVLIALYGFNGRPLVLLTRCVRREEQHSLVTLEGREQHSLVMLKGKEEHSLVILAGSKNAAGSILTRSPGQETPTGCQLFRCTGREDALRKRMTPA